MRFSIEVYPLNFDHLIYQDIMRGLPLSDAVDDPFIQQLLVQAPELKQAFVSGHIIGIVGFQIPEITLRSDTPRDLIQKLQSFGFIVRVISMNGN